MTLKTPEIKAINFTDKKKSTIIADGQKSQMPHGSSKAADKYNNNPAEYKSTNTLSR